MARPVTGVLRTPTLHIASNRWRLRVGYKHSASDSRAEADHWWPNPTQATTCPPAVVAHAVAVHDQWAALVADWTNISSYMSHLESSRDWARPVWVSAEKIGEARQHVEKIRAKKSRALEVQTASIAARIGVDALADKRLAENLTKFYPELHGLAVACPICGNLYPENAVEGPMPILMLERYSPTGNLRNTSDETSLVL